MPADQESALIGTSIASNMERVSVSVVELAAAIGVIPDAVYKMRRGEGVTGWIRLKRVAEALKTDPNTLLGVSDGLGDEFLAEMMIESFVALEVERRFAQKLAGVILAAVRAPRGGVDPETARQEARLKLSVAIHMLGRQNHR